MLIKNVIKLLGIDTIIEQANLLLVEIEKMIHIFPTKELMKLENENQTDLVFMI